MPKLPIISGKNFLRVLRKYGFIVVRQRGSHVFVEHKEEHARCTVIPIHGNEDLGVGILRSILRDLDISVEDLLKWLKGE